METNRDWGDVWNTQVNSSELSLLKATFKRYQMEHKMKQDSLDRSHSELKKLRRKSQGKNANKYELKENEVRGTRALHTDMTPQNAVLSDTLALKCSLICIADSDNLTSVPIQLA